MSPPTLTVEQIAKAAQRKAAKLAKKTALLAQAEAQAEGSGSNGPSDEQLAELEKRRFLQRPWIDVGSSIGDGGDKKRGSMRIVSWNVLGQTLVRRELFPGSDCLKWGDRRPMLMAELEHHGSTADIICLQECDRLAAYLPALPHHSHLQAFGRDKQHGLVIFYRSDRFTVRVHKIVHLDEEELTPSAESKAEAEAEAEDAQGGTEYAGRKRRGGTRQTRNIGLIAALQDKEDERRGMVVSTTHLFWHPKYAYERVRQCIVLLRALRQFQKDNECAHWPATFTGDLNTQPSEATYQLLVAPRKALPQPFRAEIDGSRLVHDSVVKICAAAVENAGAEGVSQSGTGINTPSAPTPTNPKSADKDDQDQDQGEGGEAGGGGDQAQGEGAGSYETGLKGTRFPQTDDGILTTDQLVEAMRGVLVNGARSAYGSTSGAWAAGKVQPDGKGEEGSGSPRQTFAQRGGFEGKYDNQGEGSEAVEGGGEPGYTCFTFLFQLTLDYLLLLPPSDSDGRQERDTPQPEIQVCSLLTPARRDQLGEGLPRKGICASDHLAVGCEVRW